MTIRQHIGELFFIGKDILGTFLDVATNVILAQTGDSTVGDVDADRVELWHPPGVVSRPATATQGKASCQAAGFKFSGHDIIVATQDTRGTTIYGNLKDGETCVYASTGQARSLWKNTGDIWDITTVGNTAGGHTVARHLGADGSWAIQGLAALISADAAGNITLGNNAASITLSAAGKIHLVGTIVQAQASGVAQVSGDVATLVGPKVVVAPGVQSALYGPKGPAGQPSTNVFISA